MGKWAYKIDVADLWRQQEDEEISFEDFVRELTDTFSSEVENIHETIGYSEAMVFEDIVQRMSMAGDEEEFDDEWHQLYDWADDNRVWINTF